MSTLKKLHSLLLRTFGAKVSNVEEMQIDKLYRFLKAGSEKDFLHECSLLKFTDTEVQSLLDLRASALKGLPKLRHKLDMSSSADRSTWPFELLYDVDVRKQQSDCMRHLHDFVRNRRVVITGPSAHIKDSGKGPEIDGHDIVVRVNFQWPLAEELQKDYGRRIDVLYHCCNGDFIPDSLARTGGAQIRFACLEMNPHSLRMKKALVAHGTRVSYLDEAIEECKLRLFAPPSTGISAITHLLTLPLKSLSVIGMTCWATNYYQDYQGDGAAERAGIGAGFPARIWEHDPAAEARLLLSMAEKDNRLSIDSEAVAIMKQALNIHS